ncbi:MAG: protein TolR [Hydrogenophilus sp.]|nr:protein TolR [Hydrogenophilus sp.]
MGRKRPLMSEINVVPYVDVMLVLLVIFMVTAPMIEMGEVELPAVSQVPLSPTEAIVVVVHADGGLGWKRSATAREERGDMEALLRTLGEVRRERPQAAVLIAADRRVAYEVVMGVLSRLRREGVTRVGLLTEGGA